MLWKGCGVLIFSCLATKTYTLSTYLNCFTMVILVSPTMYVFMENNIYLYISHLELCHFPCDKDEKNKKKKMQIKQTVWKIHLSQRTTKPTIRLVRPAKTWIFAGHTGLIVGFVLHWLIFIFHYHVNNKAADQPMQTHNLVRILQCAIHILTLVLRNQDIPCLCKQCRSRSVGSQLIWSCTVCSHVNMY